MNLDNYSIVNHKINFDHSSYANLENLLNNDFNKLAALDDYLNELLYLKNNWNNVPIRDEYIECKLNGFWDWEILNEYNVTGNWFIVIGLDDLTGYINADTKTFYLENSILTNLPIVQMSLDEFIDVLEQWKVILMN